MLHLCAPVILVYYIFPEVIFGLKKESWLILGFAGFFLLEVIRLYRGKLYFGMREYERKRLSAYTWAGIGMFLGFLFFPMPFVVCSLLGLCWTDPIIGEMRIREKMRYYPGLPLMVYFFIVFICMWIFSDLSLLAMFILGAVGSVTAVAVEKPKLPVDDDFLMLFVPLLVMTLVYEYMMLTGLASL